MNDATRQPPARLRAAWLCTQVCYGGLLAQFALLNLIRPQGSWLSWLLQTIPLLLVLPGILAGRHRSYSWLCFVLLMYFTVYVVNVMSPQGGWTDTVALALIIVMFIAAMMTSRWLQHWPLQTTHAKE